MAEITKIIDTSRYEQYLSQIEDITASIQKIEFEKDMGQVA